MVPGLKPRRCQIPLPAQNRCTADLKCCNGRHSKSTAKPQTLLQRAPHKSSNRPHTPQQTVAQTCRESRCSWCRSNRIDFQTCCCVQNRPQECINTNNTQGCSPQACTLSAKRVAMLPGSLPPAYQQATPLGEPGAAHLRLMPQPRRSADFHTTCSNIWFRARHSSGMGSALDDKSRATARRCLRMCGL